MKFVLLIYLIVFILKLASSLLSDAKIKMIVDVIKSYEKPTSVIAKVCWSKTNKINFVNCLNNLAIPKTIRFIDEQEDKENDITHFNSRVTMVVVDMNCDVRNFLKNANKTGKFTNYARWLVLGNNSSMDDIINSELNNLHILTDSEVVVSHNGVNDTVNLHLIYRMMRHLKWTIEYFGKWTIASGFEKSKHIKDVTTSLRRKNFAKEPINTSIVSIDNTSNSEPHYINYNGNIIGLDSTAMSSYQHIGRLYDFINATKVLLFTDTWGYLINDTWNGMVGTVARGEAEIAGSIIFISKPRLQVLEYLSHPTPIRPRLVFRKPPLSYENNLFLLPFKTAVWFCIGGFICILVLTLYVIAKWETVKDQSDDKNYQSLNVSDVAILVISAITQQGSTSELKGTLGRVVTFILFLTFLFLYTSYSASIVALLQSSSNQIRTLKDLLNSKLEVGVEDTPYNRHYFTTEKDPVKKAIYETKIAPKGSKPKFMSLYDGVKNLQTKPFAFNMNQGTGYRLVERYFYEHEKCGFEELEYLQDNIPYLCCRKNSPYKELFKIVLFRNQEHGLNDRINRHYYSKKPTCTVRGGSFGSVNMIDCYPALLMLIYGMIFACVLLLAEIFIHRKQTIIHSCLF